MPYVDGCIPVDVQHVQIHTSPQPRQSLDGPWLVGQHCLVQGRLPVLVMDVWLASSSNQLSGQGHVTSCDRSVILVIGLTVSMQKACPPSHAGKRGVCCKLSHRLGSAPLDSSKLMQPAEPVWAARCRATKQQKKRKGLSSSNTVHNNPSKSLNLPSVNPYNVFVIDAVTSCEIDISVFQLQLVYLAHLENECP